jgi:hypothetical protein
MPIMVGGTLIVGSNPHGDGGDPGNPNVTPNDNAGMESPNDGPFHDDPLDDDPLDNGLVNDGFPDDGLLDDIPDSGTDSAAGGGANSVPEPTAIFVWLVLGALVSLKRWRKQ